MDSKKNNIMWLVEVQKLGRLIIGLLLVVCFSTVSCVQTKKIVYFQGDTLSYQSVNVELPNQKKIEEGDILAIFINSLDSDANLLLNQPNINSLTISNYSGNSGFGKGQPIGYQVEKEGFISLPYIGRIKLSNLTIQQASDTLYSRLNIFLKEPSVSIRFLNHKFSVLGEVSRPSVYNIIEEKITLPEALGMAGDLTIFGRRDNVLLIREKIKGKREFIRLDLTNKKILTSPYYYVEPNDVIYVEPLKTKATVTDQNYQLVPIFTGIVSALGILILNLRK